MGETGLRTRAAEVEVRLPAKLGDVRFGLVSAGGRADVDDVTAARPSRPLSQAVPDPEPGRLDPGYGDEFDAQQLDGAWQWVRDPAASVEDGALVFPLQARDLTPDRRDASLLVRDAPPGSTEWMVEAKLRLSFGDARPVGFPKAGIVVYAGDDEFAGLVHVAHSGIRRTDLVVQAPFDGDVLSGSGWIGPPGEEATFLRIHHTTSADAEHVLRAGTSPNGRDWTWGAAYTLPSTAHLRLALAAFAAFEDDHTARYEYVRTYR